MNAVQRHELDAIRREQRELQTRLAALETRVEHFGQRAEEMSGEDALAVLPTGEAPAPAPPPVAATPPPLPVAPSAPALPLVFAKTPEPADGETPPAAPPPPVAAPPQVPRDSLEMQIGMTWLVRIGVVLVLTGLAWMGSHLYQHVVPILGPAAKVALLYLGAGLLTGAGAWLERSRLAAETERLGDYARVVFAGGLAAVYYVTYAAHWNPHLRVVADPLLAGALLLGWAAFMVFLADRRRSETLATFAILLAFYTSAVNEISAFTLVANLFLTGGAVYLLRRQLWRIFPYVSLLATFGSYGVWQFSHAYFEGGALAAPGFWVKSGFLLLYWLLFTWAVFTTDERVLPAWRRAGFVTITNGAYFGLTTWLLLAAYPGSFWKLALGFGVVLLALAETSRRWSRQPIANLEDAYLLQGTLLTTLGFIGYFTGWQLGLVLAVQSAVLLWRAGQRGSFLLLGMSGVAAGVSLFYTLDRAPLDDKALLWTLGLADGALLIGNAWWSQRLLEGSRRDERSDFAGALVLATWWFPLLGAVAWFCTVQTAVLAEIDRAPILAGAAVLLTASIYALRVRPLTWIAQIFLFAAGLYWLAGRPVPMSLATMPPAWNTLLVLGAALAIGHWWQRQRRPRDGSPHAYFAFVPAACDALLAVILLGAWLRPHAPWGDAGWMAEAALLSLAVLGYGRLTRYPALAMSGQFLLLVGVAQFLRLAAWSYQPSTVERALALCPMAAMVATLAIRRRLVPADKPDRGWRAGLVGGYEFVAMLLFLVWVETYAFDKAFAVYCAGGAAVFALGCVLREKRWIILSVLPTVAALVVLWFVTESSGRREWQTLLGALILAGQQQFGKRWLKADAPGFFPARTQGALMVAAVFCAWAFLTARMARWEGSAFTLAASWSLFAPLVFAAGLVLRERVYRWLGLLILAATLGHIILFDVSHLDSLGRAISAFALGLVVLGMGFVYNRYQSKFRDLL